MEAEETNPIADNLYTYTTTLQKDLYPYTDNLYTETQQKVLFALPIIPGILSVIGSSLIIYVIFSDAKRKLQRVYHRVLAAYSVIDVMVSLQHALSSLVVPKGTPGVYGAMGNWYTCQANGFFIQFGFSLGLYLAFICLYYLLMVKYTFRGETIAKKIEVYVHIFAFLFPLLQGVLMVVLDMYNPSNISTGQCFINCYPANCVREDGIECERGEDYVVWNLINYPPLAVYFQVVLISCVLTYRTVKNTKIRQDRWSFPRSNLIDLRSAAFTPERVTPDTRKHSRRDQLWAFITRRPLDLDGRDHTSVGRVEPLTETTQQTFIQCMMYITSFFVTYIAVGVVSVGALVFDGVEENRTFYFFWVSLSKILVPSSGIWNFSIFCRPRLIILRKRNPDVSTMALLWQIIFHSKQQTAATQRIPIAPLSIKDENDDDEFTPELFTANRDSVEEENNDDIDLDASTLPPSQFQLDAEGNCIPSQSETNDEIVLGAIRLS